MTSGLTATKKLSFKARLVKTLVYFDGPQVVLLRGPRGVNIIAVAIEREDMEYPFFACKVMKRDWRKYLDQKVDLYYLYQFTPDRSYFFFDWNDIEKEKVTLVQATRPEFTNSDYWPDRGFFSSAHTELLSEQEEMESTSQVFNIDGSWETVDFSRFYGKLSDLYAIFFAQRTLASPDTTDTARQGIKTSIRTRLWKGGGSYTGFYKTLADYFPGLNPLRVSRIQYASPGQIELRGEEAVFQEILKTVATVGPSYREAKEAYSQIDGILAREKLKTAKPDAEFSSNAIAKHVKNKSDFMLMKLGIDSPDEFFTSCDGNILVYAKVSLSIFRRFNGVYSFFVEGRVDVGDE